MAETASQGTSSRDPATSRRARLSASALALVDRLTGPGMARAGEEERRQARLTVAINLTVATAAAVLFGTAVSTGAHPVASAMLLAVMALTLLAATGQRLGVPLAVTANAFPFVLFVPCAVVGVASGGRATGAMMTLLVIPMIGVALRGRRGCIGWTIASVTTVALAGLVSASDLESIYPEDVLIWEQTRFLQLGIEIAFLGALGLVFEWVRQQSLAEARSSRDALVESETRYRALAENAGDVVAELDLRLCFRFVGSNCADVVGWTPEELVGRSFGEHVHPDDLEHVQERFQSQSSVDSVVTLTFRFQHKDGRWLHVESSAKRYRTEQGRHRVVAITRDVTRLRQAQLAMRRSERLSSLGTLAAGMAHQINNPIGSVLAASELARLQIEDGSLETAQETVRSIGQEARRAGDIVRNLLKFSRDEDSVHGRQDLVEQCRRACELTRTYAGERSIEIVFLPVDGPRHVEMNGVEIEQVLINLLRNAVEARPESKQIEMRMEDAGASVRVIVEDDGVGIPRDAVSRIFDPFFTTRLGQGGTGLGLSVAHGIIEDHGGQITVDSEPGRGTRFRIDLPRL